MAVKISFLDPSRARVETDSGEVFILGFGSIFNYQLDQQFDGYFTKTLTALFDKYYDGNFNSVWGKIQAGMIRAKLTPIFWAIDDRDKERERIGNRIKELRKEQGMDAKELAQKIGTDASNLSRIEQGRFSVGLHTLCKIANVLNMKIDFVPVNKEDLK